jgi:hypothetical protein
MVDNVEESAFIWMEIYPSRFKRVSVQIKNYFGKKCFFQKYREHALVTCKHIHQTIGSGFNLKNKFHALMKSFSFHRIFFTR